jgi:hypothetical protein
MRSVGYEPSTRVLEIEFQSGAIYQYVEVPAAVYQGLRQAESKGKYFNREIRDEYQYLSMDPAPRQSRAKRAN